MQTEGPSDRPVPLHLICPVELNIFESFFFID